MCRYLFFYILLRSILFVEFFDFGLNDFTTYDFRLHPYDML